MLQVNPLNKLRPEGRKMYAFSGLMKMRLSLLILEKNKYVRSDIGEKTAYSAPYLVTIIIIILHLLFIIYLFIKRSDHLRSPCFHAEQVVAFFYLPQIKEDSAYVWSDSHYQNNR